jgi:small-conductance mechanosensitive channel
MTIWNDILESTAQHPQMYRNLLISLVVIIIITILRNIIVRLVNRRLEDAMVRYQWQKSSGYVAALMIVIILVPLWLGGVQDLVTYLGLISAGLAIALQGLILDFVGWLFIMIRRPFRVGDRIEIGKFAGDVIDLRVFQFSMIEIGNWVDADQSTGRIINIPNRQVFSEVMANFSSGFEFIWNEIPVLLTFESNWKKAKKIVEEISERHGNALTESAHDEIKKASRKYLIFYKNLSPRVYTTVKNSGVLLTMRYICEPRSRRGSAEAIWEEILDKFEACDDIDFAYPTVRYYDNRVEGKPEARA